MSADGAPVHASCAAIDGQGVVLAGPSGIGKSDLLLRLIDEGATLVSDDQTLIRREGETLMAAPPPALAGLVEIRSVGLLRLPVWGEAKLALWVDLAALDEGLERLPQKEYVCLQSVSIPRVRLPALAASTPAAIRAILKGTIEDV